MPQRKNQGAVARRVETSLGRIAVAAYRHAVIVLIMIVGLGGVGLLSARQLKLDTDLSRLLPESFQSVQDLEALRDRFGGVGYVVVLARGADPETLIRFARDAAGRLEELPDVGYVEWRRPVEFFRSHALYYMDVGDLETIRDRLEARHEWEVLRANPLYVDLGDGQEPPSLDFGDLEAKYAGELGGAGAFEEMPSPYYMDEDREVVAVLVKPDGLASNMDFAQEMIDRVETSLARMEPQAYGSGVTVQLTGRYKKRVDMHNQIRRDLAVVSLTALSLMVAYVAWHFCRVAAVVLVFIPLLVGVLWTFGFTGAVFGELNILTAFIGAILLGLGIDHGIHLLSRYQFECTLHQCDDDAIFNSFSTSGRAVLVSALTTIAAFAGLALSEFKAFYEFGVIAATGMLLIVVSYLICVPALLGVAHWLQWRPKPLARPCDSPYGLWLSRRPLTILAVFACLGLAAVTGLWRVTFNYDFAVLNDGDLPSYRLDSFVNERILGHSQTPMVVFASSPGAEERYVEALRRRKARYGEASSVDFFLSLGDLVPPRQEQKQALIREIGNLVKKMDRDQMEEGLRERLGRIRAMTEAAPFGREDLPPEITRRFQPQSGGEGSFVLIFPAVRLTEGERILELGRELRNVPVEGGDAIRAAGEEMVMADMLNMVFEEAAPVLLVTAALVLLVEWVLLGRLLPALMCLIPSAFTLLITVGLVPYAGLQLNYLNIVAIPVLLGIGVDAGVHLVMHREQGLGISAVIAKVGRPIAAAVLTTGVGFGSMILAHHPGLRSFGELALLGLGVNFLTCMAGLAPMMALFNPFGRARQAGGPGTSC